MRPCGATSPAHPRARSRSSPGRAGKLYLATVLDLASRRLAGFALGERRDSVLARAALCMAAAVRGGRIDGVIFHSDRGGEYVGDLSTRACRSLGAIQSMGRAGSALDNAAAESFNSTLEHELLSRRRFETKDQARRDIARFVDAYNQRRRTAAARCSRPSPTSRSSPTEPPTRTDKVRRRDPQPAPSPLAPAHRRTRGRGPTTMALDWGFKWASPEIKHPEAAGGRAISDAGAPTAPSPISNPPRAAGTGRQLAGPAINTAEPALPLATDTPPMGHLWSMGQGRLVCPRRRLVAAWRREAGRVSHGPFLIDRGDWPALSEASGGARLPGRRP